MNTAIIITRSCNYKTSYDTVKKLIVDALGTMYLKSNFDDADNALLYDTKLSYDEKKYLQDEVDKLTEQNETINLLFIEAEDTFDQSETFISANCYNY